MMSSLKAQQTISSELGNSGTSPYEVATVNVDGTDVFGTGLKNDIGDYNCFLNVIIQVFSEQCHLCCFTILFIYAFHCYFTIYSACAFHLTIQCLTVSRCFFYNFSPCGI